MNDLIRLLSGDMLDTPTLLSNILVIAVPVGLFLLVLNILGVF